MLSVTTMVAPIDMRFVTVPIPAIVYPGASSKKTSVATMYPSMTQDGVVAMRKFRCGSMTPLGVLSVPLV